MLENGSPAAPQIELVYGFSFTLHCQSNLMAVYLGSRSRTAALDTA